MQLVVLSTIKCFCIVTNHIENSVMKAVMKAVMKVLMAYLSRSSTFAVIVSRLV